MDPLAALQAEIKKRKLEHSTTLSSKRRWRSQAEIEAERERVYQQQESEENQLNLEKRRKKQAQELSKLSETKRIFSESRTCSTESNKTGDVANGGHERNIIVDSSPKKRDQDKPPLERADIIRRLRNMKQPATFFGETDWERFNRLRDLQLSQEDQSDGQKNLYQTKLREVREKEAKEDVHEFTGVKLQTSNDTSGNDSEEKERNDTKSWQDTLCKEDYVHSAIRNYLRLWYTEIEGMSKEERRTNKGRSQLVTYEQTKHWLQPLEKLLRKRKLSKAILDALRDIFDAAARRQYMLATRLYLERLAIGNAPWPMGATQVGIHSRAAREKIGEDKIAHVMNDEETRKYIQAVKRLLTVAQRHFSTNPPDMASS